MSETKLRNRAGYDEDFYAWCQEQADLLRAGEVDLLDRAHLIEELDTMSGRERQALSSFLRNVMIHMLKMQLQPEKRSRSWLISIANGRADAADQLEQSPSLRRFLPELFVKEYARARQLAALQMRRRTTEMPADPPFSLAQILGEASFAPEEEYRRKIE